MDPEDLLGKNLQFAGGLRLESILGYGSFATVFKGVGKDGQVYAVKWLNKVGMSEREQALQKDEVMYMKILGDHKNIIHLYDVIETKDSLFLVLELCVTDLYELITHSEKPLETERVKRFFNEICDGVKHCHNNHIYHRDLKPENILLSSDDHCKISDFGLCCFDEWTNDFNCGSLRYMSPECIDNEDNYDDYDDDDDDYDDDDYDEDNYYGGRRRREEKNSYECNSRGSDVWALGVILINMIFGQNPWSSADMENPTFNMFIRKDPDVLQRKLGLSDQFNHVVKRMFSKNVRDRYSLDELRREVNRIDVFTDFSKRVENYLGIDDELINMANMASEEARDGNDEENTDDYDEWYGGRDYSGHNDLVVPDIDTLELGNEGRKSRTQGSSRRYAMDDEDGLDSSEYSLNYLKNNIPVIGSWGDDFDDDDNMAAELTPRVREEDEEEDQAYDDADSTSTSKMILSSANEDSDFPVAWDSQQAPGNSWSDENVKDPKGSLDQKMEIYDYDYETKLQEWKKEDQESDDDISLTTPTVEKIASQRNHGFTGKAGDGDANANHPSHDGHHIKNKSVQLRWEDLFDSDGEKNEHATVNSPSSEEVSPASANWSGKEGRFHISEQALPSSWNYQQGVSWGDMMDDDDEDLIPSKPQDEDMMSNARPTAFIEDSNDEREDEKEKLMDAEDEISFKKERIPIPSEVSSLVTPSLLTNGMQKNLNSREKRTHKEKKLAAKHKAKGMKDAKEAKEAKGTPGKETKTKKLTTTLKDKKSSGTVTKEVKEAKEAKESRHHHKSKKEKEDVGAIKIKTNGKHKHHHHHHHHDKNAAMDDAPHSYLEKSTGKDRKYAKYSEKTAIKQRNRNHRHKTSSHSLGAQTDSTLNNLSNPLTTLNTTGEEEQLSPNAHTPISTTKNTHTIKTNNTRNMNKHRHPKSPKHQNKSPIPRENEDNQIQTQTQTQIETQIETQTKTQTQPSINTNINTITNSNSNSNSNLKLNSTIATINAKSDITNPHLNINTNTINTHHKNQKNSNTISTISSITPIKPSSVQLDWEDLFSSDGEERTFTTAESIKTNPDKCFSIEETLEAEDEVFSLSNNIKALDIENEKNYKKHSSTVNKMVDSAISVGETNLSKEIKNLKLH